MFHGSYSNRLEYHQSTTISRLLTVNNSSSTAENDSLTQDYRYIIKQHRDFLSACRRGDISVVRSMLSINRIDISIKNRVSVVIASSNGHLNVVKELVNDGRFDPSCHNNSAIIAASKNGHASIVKYLLSKIESNPQDKFNQALKEACSNGHSDVVKVLINDERITACIHCIRVANAKGYPEITYLLAKAMWPKGYVDIPPNMRYLNHIIYQGAIIASGTKEAESIIKCWIKGKATNKTREIYYSKAQHQSSLTIEGMYAPLCISEFVGCQDVRAEAGKEAIFENFMNNLMSSSYYHAKVERAYKKGRIESNERNGYGKRAIVVYKP